MKAQAQAIEVFHPRQAPHLAPIARAIEPAIAAELAQVLATPPMIQAFAEAIAEQREVLAVFANFRRTWWQKLGLE